MPQTPLPRTGRPIVLIVDDDRIFQRVLSYLVGRFGCEAARATDGSTAVQFCAAGCVDLVLMDISMPIMDGITATRHIRRDEAVSGRRIPILGLSGFESRHLSGMAREAGMDAYLEKPVSIEVLREAIHLHGAMSAPAAHGGSAIGVHGDGSPWIGRTPMVTESSVRRSLGMDGWVANR